MPRTWATARTAAAAARLRVSWATLKRARNGARRAESATTSVVMARSTAATGKPP